jgi:hypothetical protein
MKFINDELADVDAAAAVVVVAAVACHLLLAVHRVGGPLKL